MPSEVYGELGKLCVFTHRGDFSVPRRYRFVAPCGVGTSLHDLLKTPDEMRQALIDNWGEYCEKKISKKEAFPLTGSLKSYVDSFDFSRVWFITPPEIINQHRRTRYWHQRFKEERPERPAVTPPPDDLQAYELTYISKLFDAYSDYAKQDLKEGKDLLALPKLQTHLRLSRGYFYSAEALARFSRDTITPGAFDGVKQHLFDSVADVTVADHANGLQCVLAVTHAAANVQLPQSDLAPYVGPADKKGICHHLANDDKLTWV